MERGTLSEFPKYRTQLSLAGLVAAGFFCVISLLLLSCSADNKISGSVKGKGNPYLAIETAANGSGQKITDIQINPNEIQTIWAVERNGVHAFERMADVAWVSSGGVGTLSISPDGHSATFTALTPGSGTIRAFNDDFETTINVYVSSYYPPGDATLALADPTTGSNLYARQSLINVTIGSDGDAEGWCLSLVQNTRPANGAACNGGTGPDQGWYGTRPTMFTFPAGDTTYTIYMWTRATAEKLASSNAVSQSITVDSQPPPAPTVSLQDPLTASTTQTYDPTIAISITNDMDAMKWCVQDWDASGSAPAAPLYNDACFVTSRPTNHTFAASGNRNISVYTLDVASNVSTTAGTHNITYTPNTPPVANDDSATTGSAVALNINVLANDTDPNGDNPLYTISKTNGTNGTVVIEADDSVTYTPGAGFYGTDTFTYTIDDGRGGTDTGTVTVTVISPYTWTGNTGDGLWSTTGNWCGTVTAGVCDHNGAPPGGSDVAVFNSFCVNCNANMNVPINVGGVDMEPSYAGTITQNAGQSVTIGSSGWVQEAGNFVGGDQNFLVPSGSITIYDGSFTAPSAILGVRNNFIIDESPGSPTFVHNSGTLQFLTGSVQSTLDSGSQALNHLVVTKTSGGFNLTVTGTSVVNGDLSMTMGTSKLAAGIISVSGNVDIVSHGGSSSMGTVNFVGSGAQSLTVGAGQYAPNLQINKPSGTLTFLSTIQIANNYTWLQGAVDPNGQTLLFSGAYQSNVTPGATVFPHVVLARTLSGYHVTLLSDMNVVDLDLDSAAGAGLRGAGKAKVTGNVDLTGGAFGGSDGTIEIVGSGPQTITGIAGARLPNLIINKPADTLFLSGEIYSQQSWTHVLGAVNAGTSLVRFVDGTHVTIDATGMEFNDVIFAKGSGGYNTTIVGAMTVAGNLDINMGTTSRLNSGEIRVKGNVSLTAHQATSNAAITLIGTAPQTISQTDDQQYWPTGMLTIDSSGGVTMMSNLYLGGAGHHFKMQSGNFALNNYDFLDIDTFYMEVGPTFDNTNGRLSYITCGGPAACPRNDTTLNPYTFVGGGGNDNFSNPLNWCGDLTTGNCTRNWPAPGRPVWSISIATVPPAISPWTTTLTSKASGFLAATVAPSPRRRPRQSPWVRETGSTPVELLMVGTV